MDKYSVLKNQFGLTSFRKGQEELVDNIINGINTVGIMPTGAGKSLCYQLPAVMFEGITLVISPLISLMKDQVNSLNQSGIRAAYLNSSLTYKQYCKAIDNARNSIYKIIYIAPERLMTSEFQRLVRAIKISMVTIDEAHCISQWGHDFRPSYLKIPEFIDSLEERPVISAFTATATTSVKEDIIQRLELVDPFTLVTGFDRKNLYFAVQKPKDKLGALRSYLRNNENKSGVVYCSTRKNVDNVCEHLNTVGYKATKYHAGLTPNERKINQDEFIYDRANIIVATNAFGMGIDKSNVSFVIHYNMPKNMESYYQEAGRAGRDGEEAECILFYSGQDVVTNQFLIEKSSENNELDEATLRSIKNKELELLKTMTFYCHTNNCLREYLLKYFGETGEHYCGNCSSCNSNFEEEDITDESQKILTCIKTTGEFFGINMIINTLKGSKNQKILNTRLPGDKAYGVMKAVSSHKIRDIINYLILNEYIEMTSGQYPILQLKEKSSKILEDEIKLSMKLLKDYKSDGGTSSSRAGANTNVVKDVDAELFERLRSLRNKYARTQKVPAYIIFTDATLKDMCRQMPKDLTEFSHVNGVGDAKLQRYGKAFLEEINS